MPSRPRNPSAKTIYLDQSTLCDAFRACTDPPTLRPDDAAAYRPLKSWIEKVAHEATPRVLTAMPCRIKMHKLDKGKTKPFYDHETYERIVGAAAKLDPRLYATILLAGDAGFRRGEIIGLNLTDVDFKRGRITVARNVFFKKGKQFIDKPKGGQTAGNAATPRLMAALQACRHLRGERVFYTDEGEPLTPKMIKLWVQRVEKAAGLPETGRVHIFRHTFATHLAMSGAPARAIQALCRHTSLEVTMGYMQYSPKSGDEAMDMLTRSRAAGGVAVAGGLVPEVSPEIAK